MKALKINFMKKQINDIWLELLHDGGKMGTDVVLDIMFWVFEDVKLQNNITFDSITLLQGCD